MYSASSPCGVALGHLVFRWWLYFLEVPSARWMLSALRLSSCPRGRQASSCGLSSGVVGLLT